MKNKGILLSLIAAVALFFAFYTPVNNAQKEAALMHSILTDLKYYHYRPLEIDDDFSVKLYDLFLDNLDNGRRWLTHSDLSQLEAFKTKLDDEAKAGTFEFLDLIISLQTASMTKTQAWYRELLSAPFDFNTGETIETDSDKKPFAKDDAELKEYWRKAMKWETMTRFADKLEKKSKGDEDLKDKTDEELEKDARKELLKVYDDYYSRWGKRKRSDFLNLYMNTLTNIFDPHSEYFEPVEKQNFDMSMSGKLEGIGARLQTDGDFTKVSEIIIGGPAWKQGILKSNDRILKVAQGDSPEWLDLTGMVITDVVQHIRGKPGTKVRLSIKKTDGTLQEISIIRDVVILDESFAKSLVIETPQQEKIGYLNLPKFYGDFSDRNARRSSSDVAIEIEKLKKENVQGIILDVRGNGGGLLTDAVRISGFFIEQGPIVQVKARDRRPELHEDDDPRVLYDGPLVVLCDQFSASASEILAGALQDYGRAVVVCVGKTTFGKGTVQLFFDLDAVVRGNPEVKPLGDVKLTIQQFFRVSGNTNQLKGVEADIALPNGWHYLKTGEREEIYALEMSQIDPVPYKQNVYKINNMGKLKDLSNKRVQENEVFKRVYARAKRIKEQRDETTQVINLQAYMEKNAQWDAENKDFDKLFENDVVTGVQNLPADLPLIAADESKKARNDEWLKNVKKDIYLSETLNIIHDMIVLK